MARSLPGLPGPPAARPWRRQYVAGHPWDYPCVPGL